MDHPLPETALRPITTLRGWLDHLASHGRLAMLQPGLALRHEIAGVATRTLVLQGDADEDNGSGRELAELLPNAEYHGIPGGHMSCVIRPDLGVTIADFLSH